MNGERAVLAGLRVLDLCEEQGALTTRLLADLGADVLKVEPPGGSPTRAFAPFLDDEPHPDRSLHFWAFEAGKRSVVLDFDSDAGRARLRELAGDADILVESQRPGYLSSRGLGYAELSALNSQLIVLSLSPYGQTGPRAQWQISDLVAWATGGVMASTGEPNREPLRGTPGLATQISGLWGGIAALAALRLRRQTGRGSHVDLSVHEATTSIAETTIYFYVYEGDRLKRNGAEHPMAAPFRPFACRDGHVLVAALGQAQWDQLIAWMAEEGAPLADLRDERWRNMVNRCAAEARPHIRSVIAPWLAAKGKHETFLAAQSRDLPFGVINTAADVLADSQLEFREAWVTVDHPDVDRQVRYPRGFFFLADGQTRDHRRAPLLDEHAGQGWREPTGNGRRTNEGRRTEADPAVLRPPSSVGAAGAFPLAGIKIADFTWAVAGPFATRILADLGADVIKAEPRNGGDILRTYPPFKNKQKEPDLAGHFNNTCRNKRSFAVDVKKPSGRAAARKLCDWADVVVDNFSAGTMHRLGFGYDELSRANPRVIQVHMSGFGLQGPRSGFISFHPTLAAIAGVLGLMAYPGDEPLGFGVSFTDFLGGLSAASAILAALERREQTGRGQLVDLAQLESAVSLLAPAFLDYQLNDRVWEPAGNRGVEYLNGPHGVYPCRGDDRWLALAVRTDAEWDRFRKLMGNPDWASDSRFSTGLGRRQAAADLDRCVADWTRQHDAFELAERLQTAGVVAGPMFDGVDLLEDPHLAARHYFHTVNHPAIGSAPIERSPIVFDGDFPGIARRAPLLGEHTAEVLTDVLGYSEEELVELYVEEAI
ncbi:MAG: CoA transferase [Chloroflexi bacterium]|nr:CoA transferase [Chloroflexota bacterium]